MILAQDCVYVSIEITYDHSDSGLKIKRYNVIRSVEKRNVVKRDIHLHNDRWEEGREIKERAIIN